MRVRSVYRREFSIATPARRASSSASWTSAASKRRPDSAPTSVSVPNVRPRAVIGAMIERAQPEPAHERRGARGRSRPATSISSVISGTYDVLPLRTTASGPGGLVGVGREALASARARARASPGRRARPRPRAARPDSSRMLTAHQSAISGIAMFATLTSVCSKSSDASSIAPARARKSARRRAARSASSSARRSVMSMTVTPTPIDLGRRGRAPACTTRSSGASRRRAERAAALAVEPRLAAVDRPRGAARRARARAGRARRRRAGRGAPRPAGRSARRAPR